MLSVFLLVTISRKHVISCNMDVGRRVGIQYGLTPCNQLQEILTYFYRRKHNFSIYARKSGNLVTNKFESYLKATINQEIDPKNCSEYSSILLWEAFEYSHRELESFNLVGFLAERRDYSTGARDKTRNTLNAIPGSPGIGKSQLLKELSEGIIIIYVLHHITST